MPTLLTPLPTAPPETRRQRRNRFRGDIEGLRAVAVLLVVAFHAGIGVVSGGFVGVDVFFVLSGFLITGLLVDELARNGRVSLGDFYARRIRRLLPLSSLVLASTAVATWLLVPPIDRGGVAGDLTSAAVWSANWRFAAQATQYMADTDKSPVLHYWSLCVEEQFYLLWPLVLILLAGRRGLAQRAWSIVARRISLVLALVVALSLALSWQQTRTGSTFAYFGLHTRAWELGVGAALALARPLLPRVSRRAAQVAALAGLGMVVGAAVLMSEATPFPGTAAAVPVLGTALLVASGARLPDEGVARALSHPLARYVGRISYAWYLWHWPVLVLAKARWGESGGGADAATASAGTRLSVPVLVAAVCVSFALAAISHHVVEQPLRQASFLRASRRRSLRFGAGLVAISLVGSATLSLGASAAEDRGGSSLASAKQARDAKPTALKGCYNDFETTTVPSAEACRLGPAHGKRTLVLIGDSHSQHWMPALERLSKERGWTIYTFAKSACTVVDAPIWLSATKHEYTSCATWRRKMLDRVSSIQGVDAVLVGRFMDYRSLVLQPDGTKTTAANVETPWRRGAAASFAKLSPTTSRILVIRDTPRPENDVPACLSRNEGHPERCSFPKATRTHLDAPLARAEVAAARGAVRLVDLTDNVCPDASCPVVAKDGTVMYRDTHHLTVAYAASLADPLGDAIEDALR